MRTSGNRIAEPGSQWGEGVRVFGSPEREHFVLAHASLIKHIAHRIQSRLPSSIDLSDLVNDGVLGLIDAIDRFDPGRGVPFGAFAELRIRGAILDSLRARDFAPRSLRRKVREMESAIRSAQLRLGRPPDDEELAAELAVAENQVSGLRSSRERTRTVSMEPRLTETLSEAWVDAFALDPFEETSRREVRRRLAQLILELPERERLIVGLYYEKALTMKEIGSILGITESRICQLHTRVVKDLRVRLERLLSAVRGHRES